MGNAAALFGLMQGLLFQWQLFAPVSSPVPHCPVVHEKMGYPVEDCHGRVEYLDIVGVPRVKIETRQRPKG